MVNRVVVLLTPIFAGLSACIVGWVAKFPGGPVLDGTELTALMVAGAASALGAAVKWLDGWQKDEDHQWVERHDA